MECSCCHRPIKVCNADVRGCGSTPASGQPMVGSTPAGEATSVSLQSTPEVRDRYKIGDRVFVTADNYGSECTIIAYRDSDGPLASHWQVRTDSGDRFWALDFEVSDV